MSKASGNRLGLHYVAESVVGTTPASPAFKELRYTGQGLNSNISTAVSEEIRSDRQTTDLVPVSQEASGNVDFELSFAEYDPFLEAALFSDFSAAVGIDAQTTVSATATGFDDTGNGFGNIAVGQWIKVAGFTANAGQNNGVYRVTSASAGSINTSPAPLAIEAAGDAVTVTGQMLRNGTTQKSFTLQKRYNDTAVLQYENYVGMHVNSISFSFENGALLTGGIDFIGLDGDFTTTQFAGATDAPTTSNDVMNAVSNLKNIEVDDSATTSTITSLSVEVSNNLRAQNAIGSLASVGIAPGKFDVSGSISQYFENADEYNKYASNTAFKLSMRAEDVNGKAYVFTFPRVKYESVTTSGGADSDVIVEAGWKALRDATTNSMMQIDRLSLDNTDIAA